MFPDTVYGAQTTQTRLASETADDLLWTKLTAPSAAPELAAARARVTFHEEASAQPLHHAIELLSRSSQSQAHVRQIVVAGRSRRMAVESHEVELQKLAAARGAGLASELPKTLGHVASAFVAAGAGASLLVVQAAQRQ